MRVCCTKRGIDGCWKCEEFETCQKLDFLKPIHADANIKNLRKLMKQGAAAFVSGKRYW